VVPTSENAAHAWKYTTTQPPAEWSTPTFDDSSWQSGTGAFARASNRAIKTPGTTWDTADIWLRQTATLNGLTPDQVSELVVRVIHRDDVDVYINGVIAFHGDGGANDYEYKRITKEAQAAIKPTGANVIAMHCHHAARGQFVDVGLFEKIMPKE
jgi:hypothetical protein